MSIFIEKYDDAIKAALADYLKLIPINPDLEDEISKLNVCLRVYMQLHLFKGQSGQEQCQRLNLMMLICKIAQRIFSRHRDPNSHFGSTIFLFKYGLFGDYPEYWRDIKEVEKFAKENGYETTIVDYYYEVDRLIESSLPPTQDENLKRYLNYVARGIIANFADDFDTLDTHHATDGWGRRVCTDEEDYKRCHRKMKLLQYKSFVLPQQISEKTIAGFMNDYSLK